MASPHRTGPPWAGVWVGRDQQQAAGTMMAKGAILGLFASTTGTSGGHMDYAPSLRAAPPATSRTSRLTRLRSAVKSGSTPRRRVVVGESEEVLILHL